MKKQIEAEADERLNSTPGLTKSGHSKN